MENRNEVIKAFRKTRIAGEEKLSKGEITWEEFCFVMLSFEAKLRSMGVVL